MEPTNIAEILRNAPTGLLLYSPMVGYVNLVGVKDEVGRRDVIEVSAQYGKMPNIKFDKYGKYVQDGERLLFPSKFRKDWDEWQSGLFGFGHFLTSTSTTPETVVTSKNNAVTAYRSDGSCITINLLDYRWATDAEKISFLRELGKNGLEWDEATLEVFAPLPETSFTEERYKEAADKIKDLQLENLKLNAILLLTGMYNVRDTDLHNKVFDRIYGAKNKLELGEIIWDYHTTLNPNIGRVNVVPSYDNMYEQKNGK